MLFWINRSIILFIVLCFLGGRKIFSLFRYLFKQLFTIQNHFYTDSIIEPIFSIMGQVSKTDGKVSARSIQTVEKIIKDMQLSTQQRKQAIQAFNKGKQEDFNLHNALQQIHMHLLFNPHQQENIIQNIVRVGHADGRPSKRKRALLHTITSNISQKIFQHHNTWQHTQDQNWEQHQTHQAYQTTSNSQQLQWAYRTLNSNSNDDIETVTKKYRKLLSKYHPDRLAARNATDTEIKAANDKTHEIKKAYELIKKSQVFNS